MVGVSVELFQSNWFGLNKLLEKLRETGTARIAEKELRGSEATIEWSNLVISNIDWCN